MQAHAVVSGWKRRLIALADHPHHTYRDTPQQLIDDEYRSRTTFAGHPEPAVAAAEQALDVRFPAVFRQYLLEMAASPVPLFGGVDLAGPAEFAAYRATALETAAGSDPALTLPPAAVVFLLRRGESFGYVLATGGFDGPVVRWAAPGVAPTPSTPTFADAVDAELRGQEELSRAFRDGGGYSKTSYPGGGALRIFPDRAPPPD